METPPALPQEQSRSSTGKLWGLWIATTIGVPLMVIGLIAANANNDAWALPFVLVPAGLGLVGHATITVFLSKAMAARRPPERRGAAMAGLIIGLLFGGWAAMFAVLFCGCLVAITAG